MSDVVVAQLSDLHFGSSSTDKDDAHNARVLLSPLSESFRRVLTAHLELPLTTRVQIVATGDITNIGDEASLDLAIAFLSGRFRNRTTGTLVGLGVDNPERLTLAPGNHDHWGGKGRKFPFLPTHDHRVHNRLPLDPHKVRSADRQLCLQVFSVDTSSGHAASFSKTNAKQPGHISPEQFEVLSDQLQTAEPDDARTVRCLLIHHDLAPDLGWKRAKASAMNPEMPRPWPLRRQDRLRLFHLAHEYEIAAILTGHQHIAMGRMRPTAEERAPAGTPLVRELRAPSALQGHAQDGLQGFLVHHLHERGTPGKIRWDVYVFGWMRHGFFMRSRPWRWFELDPLAST